MKSKSKLSASANASLRRSIGLKCLSGGYGKVSLALSVWLVGLACLMDVASRDVGVFFCVASCRWHSAQVELLEQERLKCVWG